MSVFGRIMSAIFGKSANAAPAGASTTPPGSAPTSPPTAPNVTTPSSGGSASGSEQKVDVAQVLDALAKENREKLDWRRSIVDLMKLLDIDSSLSARKELAKELNYSGDANDSATMNIWLHKQVIKKLEENGGKVPAELKD